MLWDFTAPHENFILFGFSDYEDWGCWTNSAYSYIEINKLTIEKNNFEKIILRFLPFCPEGRGSFSFTISTTWGFKESFTVTRYHELITTIPISECSSYRISIETDHLLSPHDLSMSSDKRILGIGFKKIVLGKSDTLFNDYDLKTDDMYVQMNTRRAIDNNGLALSGFCETLLGNREVISDAMSTFIIKYALEGKSSEALDIFSGSCALKSIPQAAVNNFKSALNLIIHGFCANDISKASLRPKNFNHSIVVIGGFFYSGSSAIYDYLRSFDRSRTLANYDFELSLVGKSFEFMKTRDKRKGAFVRYFLCHLMNIFLPARHIDSFNLKKKEFSIFESVHQGYGRVSIEEYSKLVLHFVERILWSNFINFKKEFTEFILGCAGLNVSGDAAVLLLNQAPPAMDILPVKAFDSRVNYFAVCRDPRDQYLDQLIAGNYYSSVDNFIEKFICDRNGFHSASSGINSIDISLIYFEEFVLSSAFRKKMADKLSLHNEVNDYFRQEISMKNIGKYKLVKDARLKRDLMIIGDRLREYLWQQ